VLMAFQGLSRGSLPFTGPRSEIGTPRYLTQKSLDLSARAMTLDTQLFLLWEEPETGRAGQRERIAPAKMPKGVRASNPSAASSTAMRR